MASQHCDRVGRCLGHGGAGYVYEAHIGGAVYALKLFFDAAQFDAELRAYLAIANVPALSGRTCRFYGIYEGVDHLFGGGKRFSGCYSRALRLELLPGPTLWDLRDQLPSDSELERLKLYLHETLSLLHDEAGVRHNDVKEDNMLISGGRDAWLLDFSHATTRADGQSDKMWQNSKRSDHSCLDQVFADAGSKNAVHELEVLLDRPDGIINEDKIASLLPRIRPSHSNRDVKDRLIRAIPTPSTKLICPMAQLFAQANRQPTALGLLDAAISRERHAIARGEGSQEALLNMLMLAAPCATRAEALRGSGTFRAAALYSDALELAREMGKAADMSFVKLLLNYGEHLRGRKMHAESLDVLEEVTNIVSKWPDDDEKKRKAIRGIDRMRSWILKREEHLKKVRATRRHR